MTTLEVDDDFDLPDCVPVADCDDLTRDEWLALRRAGLGGSDASTVCGLNDFASPYVLWLDKTGIILPDDFDGNDATWWGTNVENTIARRFAEEQPRFEVVRHPMMLQSIERPWQLGNPDRYLWDRETETFGVLELKWTGEHRAAGWTGDRHEGAVPLPATLQACHYMAVTGLPFAFAAAVIGSRYVDRYIPRDDDLIATLNEREAEFWRLVETETPPPVDGSESTLEALKRLYADADIEAAVELCPDDAKTYDLWIEAKRAAKRTKEIEQELGNQLRAAIGTATAATIAGRPVITYKPHSQSRFDEEAFKQAHPDLWLEFKRTSEVRPLRAKERL